MRARSGTQREKTTGAKATASKSWGKAHMPQGIAKLADTPGRVELIFERWRKDVRCRRVRFSSSGAKRWTQRYMVVWSTATLRAASMRSRSR